MGKILQTHPKAVQAHKDIVLRCLNDKDESIRLRLVYYNFLTKKVNVLLFLDLWIFYMEWFLRKILWKL